MLHVMVFTLNYIYCYSHIAVKFALKTTDYRHVNVEHKMSHIICIMHFGYLHMLYNAYQSTSNDFVKPSNAYIAGMTTLNSSASRHSFAERVVTQHFISALVPASLQLSTFHHKIKHANVYNLLVSFSDPKGCWRYWTDGYRKEPLAQDFYWEHSDERIKFLPWHSAPANETKRNWLRLNRHTDDEQKSWGLLAATDDLQGAYPTCYICEIDLPIY